MNISLTKLESLLIRAANKHVNQEEAEYFAREQIDTHLKKFPKANIIKEAIRDLNSWDQSSKKKLRIQTDKPSSLLIDFQGLGPSLKLKYIHDELEKKSKKNGIAMVGINNSAGFDTLNFWTDGLGKRDMIGICLFNGGPTSVVPFNGTKGILGTNPLSYAIPTLTDPIIVDMATSEIPFFKIRNAKENKKELKDNVAVDKDGFITTDPNKALYSKNRVSNLLPIGGGYKGYALVLLIEILTGSLVKSFLSNEMSRDYITQEHGGLIIAIDIESFTPLATFKKSVSGLCQKIRSQKPKSGEKIIIPGDSSYQRAKITRDNKEINISSKLFNKLKELSK